MTSTSTGVVTITFGHPWNWPPRAMPSWWLQMSWCQKGTRPSATNMLALGLLDVTIHINHTSKHTYHVTDHTNTSRKRLGDRQLVGFSVTDRFVFSHRWCLMNLWLKCIISWMVICILWLVSWLLSGFYLWWQRENHSSFIIQANCTNKPLVRWFLPTTG